MARVCDTHESLLWGSQTFPPIILVFRLCLFGHLGAFVSCAHTNLKTCNTPSASSTLSVSRFYAWPIQAACCNDQVPHLHYPGFGWRVVDCTEGFSNFKIRIPELQLFTSQEPYPKTPKPQTPKAFGGVDGPAGASSPPPWPWSGLPGRGRDFLTRHAYILIT